MKLRKINSNGLVLEGVYQDENGEFQFDYSEDGEDHFIKFNNDIKSMNVNGVTVYVGYEPSPSNIESDELTFASSSIEELEKHLNGKKEALKSKKEELREAKSMPDRNLFDKINVHLRLLNSTYDSHKGQTLIKNMTGNKPFDYEALANNEQKIESLESEIDTIQSEINELKEKIEPFRKEYSEQSKGKRKLFSSLMTSFMKKLRKGGKEYDEFIKYSIDKFLSLGKSYDVVVVMDSSKFMADIVADSIANSLGIPKIKPFSKVPANKIEIDYSKILSDLGKKEHDSLVKYISKHNNKPVNISRLPAKVRPYVKYFESESLETLYNRSVLAVDDIIYSGSTMAQMIDELELHCKSLEGYALFKL